VLGEDRLVTRASLGGVPALVAVATLALSGCTDGGDESSPGAAASSPTVTPSGTGSEPTVEPPPPPPPAAACYRIGLVGATRQTNDTRPTSCRRPHTAQTIHVGRLDLTPSGRRVTVGSAAAQRQPARVCPGRLQQYVGGTVDVLRRSRFEVVWFTPPLDEADRGARWFRCDAVAVADDERLLRLPLGNGLRGVLDRPGALATYGLCGTAQPGSRGFRRVACALRHSWEAVGTIDLAGGRRYPGTGRVRTAGDQTCADRVRTRSGPVLEFSYGWEWPTRAQWAAGQHYGYCWAPSRPS
jgi:Septum formation